MAVFVVIFAFAAMACAQRKDYAELLRRTCAHEEDKRRKAIIAALSQAFLLDFVNAESDGRLKFAFKPNPKFSPPTRETQVLKGMQGWLWIDPVSERIAEVQGELFKDVNFGWGILGRLHKGGRFRVIQNQIAPGVWHITRLELDFRGRLLIFKSLRIVQKENSEAFVPNPPDIDVRKALQLLLAQYSSDM